MIENQIPDVVIGRLPIYMLRLNQLLRDGQQLVSSAQLAEMVGIPATQIRKDLSWFGGFGKQGSGYDVVHLLDRLKTILNLDRIWQVVVVGAGNLGKAVVEYDGFRRKGFEIIAAFDNEPSLIGSKVGHLVVKSMTEMEACIQQNQVLIAALTVPTSAAPEVADKLVRVGIKAILNYAPVTLRMPDDVQVSYIDPVLSMQKMTYYLPRE
ncbi:MAG: redox-sensing transcriptional repressor Rex [Anaerolineaceae bacterium]|nr:redox-sensing transcriptional repressor Rex [Anaerolineaceae bacterium]